MRFMVSTKGKAYNTQSLILSSFFLQIYCLHCLSMERFLKVQQSQTPVLCWRCGNVKVGRFALYLFYRIIVWRQTEQIVMQCVMAHYGLMVNDTRLLLHVQHFPRSLQAKWFKFPKLIFIIIDCTCILLSFSDWLEAHG